MSSRQRRRRHRPLVALQAVGVAAQRVDLAVVRDHAERLRQPPTGKRVRAVTLMHDRQGRANALVGQIGIIREKLRREEHPLVANRAAGHRRNVKLLGRIAQLLDHAAFGPLAGDIQPPLQFFFAAALAVDENLLDDRFGIAGDIAQAGVVGRHVAECREPSDLPASIISSKIRSQRPRSSSFCGKKSIATPYCLGAGSSKPKLGARLAKNSCGICIKMPAPSPVDSSALDAPRCIRFSSTCLPYSTMAWSGLPEMLTTAPMPHASCSNCGSYKPWDFGKLCMDNLNFHNNLAVQATTREWVSPTYCFGSGLHGRNIAVVSLAETSMNHTVAANFGIKGLDRIISYLGEAQRFSPRNSVLTISYYHKKG